MLDELAFGAQAVAWPLIRGDLGLDYAQVGLLVAIPIAIGNIVEPLVGVAGDVGNRRWLVRAGGVGFALAALLTATSGGFVTLLVALALFNPSSGAFVSLSQATLIDLDPSRADRSMARWVVAGSIGQLLGAGLVAFAVQAGIGWRGAYAVVAALTAIVLAAAWRWPFATPQGHEWTRGALVALGEGVREAIRALRRGAVVRWLSLLQASDLLLDVLHGFLALYLVDVAGHSPAEAAVAVATWTVAGVAGDILLLPLLERVSGTRHLRTTALMAAIVYAAFLLLPGRAVQLPLLALLGLLHAGWYAILAARLYESMPGRSATVNTVGNAFGLVGSLIPLGLGVVADRLGLSVAMWLLIAGPVALLVGLHRVPQPPSR